MTQTYYNTHDDSVNSSDQIRSPSHETHSFNVQIASECGLHEAVLYQHILYWCRLNRSKGQNFIDGKTWSYMDNDEIMHMLPYMTRKTLLEAVKKLKDYGYILVEQFGRPQAGTGELNKFNKVNWYTIADQSALSNYNKSYESPKKGPSNIPDQKLENSNSFYESPKKGPSGIPKRDSPSYYTSSKNTDEVCCAHAPGIIRKVGKDGQEIRIDESEIMLRMLHEKFDYKTQHFREAWNIMANYTGPIYDPYLFVKQTLENIQIKEKSKNIRKAQAKEKECNSQKSSKSNENDKQSDGSNTISENVTRKPVFHNCLEMIENFKKQCNGSPIPGTS